MKITLVSITVLLFLSCSYPKKDKTEAYIAGFKTIQTVDKSRVYKPNTDTTDYLHYRPLDIDIWYPASSNGDSAILFRDLLGLLEKRANYYTASDAGNGLTQQVAQSFSEGFKCSDSSRVLNFKTRSFQNAKSVNAKFPVVVYLSSFNGMCFENFALFEDLAINGYVVVSISSIGRFPGDMTMKNEDMLQQVFDAISSLQYLKDNPNTDLSKVGIIGYSWGGLSGTVLASKLANVACLISFDGSEFHHYGQAIEEDNDFEGIKNSEEFKNLSLSIPYLRLESSPITKSNRKDSVYDFSEKLSSSKLILKVDSTEHQDFCCLPVIVRASGNCKNNQFFNTITKLTVSFLDEHLKKTNTFSQTLGQEMNKTVTQK
jgi:pimeloyl-ACP methyl ester carboxylesterase